MTEKDSFGVSISTEKPARPDIHSSNSSTGGRIRKIRRAQDIFDHLVNAVHNGALAARFEEGSFQIYPGVCVDKDGFQDVLDAYADRLIQAGTTRKDVRRIKEAIKQQFLGGSLGDQSQIVTRLTALVNNTQGFSEKK